MNNESTEYIGKNQFKFQVEMTQNTNVGEININSYYTIKMRMSVINWLMNTDNSVMI